MHLAILDNSVDYEAWLTANTGYCKRQRSRLTVDACRQNQRLSQSDRGDLRCQGCGGLENQPEETRDPFKLYLAYPCHDEPSQPESAEQTNNHEATEEIEAIQIGEADQDDSSILANLLLDLDEETLAAITNGNSDFCRELQSLLIEEDDPDETPEQLAASFLKAARQEKPQRYAVFMGRCPRCDGYMDNTRERGDDDVYRCFACSWRTSPAYEWNRANPESARQEN